MATVLLYLEIVVAIFVCLLFLCCWRWINKTSPAINWPILGMLPDLLLNVSDVHNFVTRVLKYYGGTFVFKGPCFTDFNFVLTSDPMNVHHICSKNFSNYGKGRKFQEIFDPLGEGIFCSESDSWKYQRKLIHSLIKQKTFELLFEKLVKEKMEKSLIPILDHVSSLGIEVDLQDIFQRFTFDNVCLTVLWYQSKYSIKICLS